MEAMQNTLSVNITLLVLVAGLAAAGIYMVLEKNLTRVLLGCILLTNAANLLIITIGGKAGEAPIVRPGIKADEYNDPLPQVLVLTSIVISFALTAFMLGIIYRSWVLARQDDIQDDTADQMVAGQDIYDVEDDFLVPDDESEFMGDDARLPEERARDDIRLIPKPRNEEKTSSNSNNDQRKDGVK